VRYVPPGLITGVQSDVKEYDVLFYGSLNEQRNRWLKELGRWMEIKVVENVYGREMLEYLSRSRVVLNLHFYRRGALEVFRVNEALCCGAQVVSERASGCMYPAAYDRLIYYAKSSMEFRAGVTKALKATPVDVQVLDNAERVKSAIAEVRSRSADRTADPIY
jgi:hypothetical protein